MAKICEQCNEIYDDSVLFCARCGTPLTTQDTNVQWFYNDGTEHGPYTQEDIIQIVRGGTLAGSTWIISSNMDNWVHLSQSELAPYQPVRTNPVPEEKKPAIRPYTQESSGKKENVFSLLIFEGLQALAILVQLISLFFFAGELNSPTGAKGSIWALMIIITLILYCASMAVGNWFLLRGTSGNEFDEQTKLLQIGQLVLNIYPLLLVFFGFLAGTGWMASLMMAL